MDSASPKMDDSASASSRMDSASNKRDGPRVSKEFLTARSRTLARIVSGASTDRARRARARRERVPLDELRTERGEPGMHAPRQQTRCLVAVANRALERGRASRPARDAAGAAATVVLAALHLARALPPQIHARRRQRVRARHGSAVEERRDQTQLLEPTLTQPRVVLSQDARGTGGTPRKTRGRAGGGVGVGG